MHNAPHVDTSMEKDGVPGQPPLMVCMHMLGPTSSDARVLREAFTLRDAGFSVMIVDVDPRRTGPTHETLYGIQMRHIFMPSWFVASRFKPWFLVKLLFLVVVGTICLLRTKADSYHALVEKALPASYIAASLRRKPLIFDSPELPLSEHAVTRWRRLHALATRLLTRMMARCAGAITVSKPIALEMQQCYGGPEVTVIRNMPAYQPPIKSDRLRQHLGLGSDIRLALYQGNVQSSRGLDRVVHAAPFLDPDIVIVMMGESRPETQTQLEEIIASEGTADRVKLIPAVPYAELLSWTASADIGLTLLPPDYSHNVRFSLPNKFFEYLMAGLPVLSSSLDAIAELLATYDIGQVVPSLSPADVGAAINAMLEDTAALARMRHNALEVARQEFCWEKEQWQLIQLYQKILTQGVARAKETVRSAV